MARLANPTAQDIEDAVERVLQSDEFSGANRLMALLKYVKNEYQAGRADGILGKTIGMDVYNRDPGSNGDLESIVRVDASRLRRRLDDYYAGSGSLDPIKIAIPKGGYAPTFETRADIVPIGITGIRKRFAGGMIRPIAIGSAFGAITIAIALAVIAVQNRPAVEPVPAASDKMVRLLELSPRAIQARDLAEDSKVLVFPATEAERVRTALSAFETAMKLDATYHGGFAGASQTNAILAGLASTPKEARQYLARAKDLADKAFLLQPDASWSMSASAWVAFLSRDFETANRLSVHATEISQNDPYIHGFDMIIAFFSGEFERALESASGRIHNDQGQFRFPFRTAQANAYFHLGDYERSIALYEEGIRRGDSAGEVNMAHMIASLQSAGRTKEAQKMTKAYVRAWPESRLSDLLFHLFQHKQDAQAVLSKMAEVGWADPLAVTSNAGDQGN